MASAVVVVVVDDDVVDDDDDGNCCHPFGQSDDIPNCIKHWPCTVKAQFPRQHLRPGHKIGSNMY